MSSSNGPRRGKLLVVSHPCVLPVNQHVYSRLLALGWEVALVAPLHWSHEYADGLFDSEPLPELEGRFVPLPTFLPGRPQRHVYRVRPSKIVRNFSPDVVFLEEETFSVPAAQWGFAAVRNTVPFGVQADENLDRPLPTPARALRAWTLRQASFIAARSPAAGRRAALWGARGSIELVPHAVPEWEPHATELERVFTVGFAGRLVPEKGIHDLVAAAAALDGPIRLLFVGNGPLREELERTVIPSGNIEVWPDVSHNEMPRAYGAMDVLVLPSRTTERWAEQFGRVLVEALWCGVPVVGADSGEIPWVVSSTGGGITFPEGDIARLTAAIVMLRDLGEGRCALAASGREAVARLFSVEAAAAALDDALRAALTRQRARVELASTTTGAARPAGGRTGR